MKDLVDRYFRGVLTDADEATAREILAHDVRHVDMVRDVAVEGLPAVLSSLRTVKSQFPELWVEATELGGTPSGDAAFAAFKGQAAGGQKPFTGVDLFRFNASRSRITEVLVYRSNWQGAGKGDARRERAPAGAVV